MFDTALSVGIAIAVVLPGFVVADLSRIGRADKTESGDLRLIMRALFYALAIHLMASPWTRALADRLDGDADFGNHVNALAFYAIGVLVLAPVVLGLLLNAELRRAERKGSLRRIHYVLGAHDSRTSWDFAFQPFDASTGTFVTVVLADGGVVGGMFGDDSWVSRSPTYPHDLYVEEQWALNEDGIPLEPLKPPRGLWVETGSVKALQFHTPGGVQ